MALTTIESKLESLDDDIKALYGLVARVEKTKDEKFLKLDLEQKILRLHSELQVAAKQAGVSLPK